MMDLCSMPFSDNYHRETLTTATTLEQSSILAPLPTARTHSSGPAFSFQQPTPSRNLNHTVKLPPLLTRQHEPASSSSTPAQSPQPSPIKTKSGFRSTLTGDMEGKIRVEERRGRLAGWFTGSSAPVTLGVLPTSDSAHSLQSSPVTRPTNNRSSTTQSSASNSRFTLFSTKTTSDKLPITNLPSPEHDELLNLDIEAALFPLGPADPFSPSSFKNLQVNAEGLLLRLQTAYKLRTSALHELTVEKKAQDEELEETETRCRHLKQQLDDMALKVLEQEKAMNEMADELAAEKHMRGEEEKARLESITLVRGPATLDAGMEPYQPRKRESTATIGSDSGFESEGDESPAESVFSKTDSPPSRSDTLSSRTSEASSPETSPQPQVPPQVLQTRPGMPHQRASTFQKILRGISSTDRGFGDEDTVDSTSQQWGCANCNGGNAAMAWCMVGDLRAQNRDLNKRVVYLEGAVESCIDIVGGFSVS
ncbi:MAG: hypothetical protein M1812_002298 [Candelaria pacifica]|nr:MAG: hypothetical protein M1812_002298 [Candelaria pacifica]